jgi:hypothetical protein
MVKHYLQQLKGRKSMVQDARWTLGTALHPSKGRKNIVQTKRSCNDALPASSPRGMKPDNRNLWSEKVWNHGVMRELAGDIYGTFAW